MVYVIFFQLLPTMFKYDKATKNKYVGKKIKTHKYNERHLYVHEYTLTFLITYDSCEKKVN